MVTRRSALGASFSLLLATPPAAAQSGHHHGADELRTRLDSAVPALMRAGEVAGLSAAVIRDKAVYWTGAFGVKNATTRAPVDGNTVFDAASLTKPVVAYAVLRLADRGLMKLDEPIADVLPNDRMKHDARYARITPRMVLSHATGLPNWGGDKLDLSFDPGTNWGYSGEGFVWLANAVEKRSGLTINEVVRLEVFEPLAMKHSSLVWSDSLEANGTVPHTIWGRARTRERPPVDQLGRANAAASLRTTAADYARFLVAVLEGRGLAAETGRQMLSVQNEATNAANFRSRPQALRSRMAWGLGWGLARGDDGTTFWHWGDNGDSKAYVVGDAARGTAIVYFANSQTGLAIASSMASLVFPGEQYAVSWLQYESHDDPARISTRSLVRAAFDGGPAAAASRYETLRTSNRGALTPGAAQSAAEALGAESSVPSADTILALAMRDFPDSSSLAVARGDLQLSAGDARAARRHYDRALATTPADTGTRRRVDWAATTLKALDSPVPLDAQAAQRYAGEYGPRVVTLEGGRLFYQRTGGRRFALVPLSTDTFTLDGNLAFRLQFVADASASTTKVVGRYLDGRQDENSRTR